METRNNVFIGTSLDGYIADSQGGLDWLDIIPNPEKIDMGYYAFTAQIDALVMGRKSFETVCSFDIDWPYEKPVFVLSNTLNELPASFQDKAFLVKGPLTEALRHIHQEGYRRLYIDGGVTIQNFLQEDLIDEMIITTIPVLLGGGVPLFGSLPKIQQFELVESKVYLKDIVQRHYRRKSM
jgi:dihydrofolate reductase